MSAKKRPLTFSNFNHAEITAGRAPAKTFREYWERTKAHRAVAAAKIAALPDGMDREARTNAIMDAAGIQPIVPEEQTSAPAKPRTNFAARVAAITAINTAKPPPVAKLEPAVALFRFRQLAASDRPAFFAAHRNELEQGVKLATGLDRSIASAQLAATARETGAPAAVETLSPAQALFRFRGLHGAERAAYFNTHRDEIKAGAQLTDGADRSKAYFEIKIAEKKGPTK